MTNKYIDTTISNAVARMLRNSDARAAHGLLSRLGRCP